MKRIQVSSSFSTGFRPEFQNVHYIEIENNPFSEGTFGGVYFCNAINGTSPSVPQVVKIFKETFPGALRHNSNTIKELQRKLSAEHAILQKSKRSLIDEYPAFRAAPQVSFHGILDGNAVTGFTSDDLCKLGFRDFDQVLQTPAELASYQSLPFNKKILFAYHLVKAFTLLEKFSYVHADLKPGALFVNPSSGECALIDFDSGAITIRSGDEPNTWGTLGDWVAPELPAQMTNLSAGAQVKVGLLSDRWSVMIAIHYLLSTVHPLFYLTELSTKVTQLYFGSTTWPNAEITASYFCGPNRSNYDAYLHWLVSAVPTSVKKCFSNTINFGYTNPAARSTYSDWRFALESVQSDVKIEEFSVSSPEIISGDNVTLTWSVPGAAEVELRFVQLVGGAPLGHQSIAHEGAIVVTPLEPTKYVIFAKGYFGKIASRSLDVLVHPRPEITLFEAVRVSIPKSEPIEIRWQVVNVEKIVLKDGGAERDVTAHTKNGFGHLSFPAVHDTIFVLCAFGKHIRSKLERQISISVYSPVRITEFKGESTLTLQSRPVKLLWQVEEASVISIHPEIGDVSGHTEVLAYPERTTRYVLTAKNELFSASSVFPIHVLPLPQITNVRLHPLPKIGVSQFPRLRMDTRISHLNHETPPQMRSQLHSSLAWVADLRTQVSGLRKQIWNHLNSNKWRPRKK